MAHSSLGTVYSGRTPPYNARICQLLSPLNPFSVRLNILTQRSHNSHTSVHNILHAQHIVHGQAPTHTDGHVDLDAVGTILAPPQQFFFFFKKKNRVISYRLSRLRCSQYAPRNLLSSFPAVLLMESYCNLKSFYHLHCCFLALPLDFVSGDADVGE